MDLIFIIKSNEIRIFKALHQETSPFYIDGEDIYEYESNDFAQDLKDKILTILNEKNFFDIAVHIAYTASEKSAAESILREFVPCRFIQAVVYDNISDPCKTARQIQTISHNKSAEFEGSFSRSNAEITQQTDMINTLKSEMDKLSAEHDSLKKEYASLEMSYSSLEIKNKSLVRANQSMQEKCKNAEIFFSTQRHRCYYKLNKNILMDITWNKRNGDVFSASLTDIGTLGHYTIKTTEQMAYYPIILNVDYKDIGIRYTNRSNGWTGEIICKKLQTLTSTTLQLKLIIIKSENIAPNETFAVLTHPNDTEEAVLKWLERTSDDFSQKLQSQSNNQ